MNIGIKAIEYVLPDKILSNDELSKIYNDWSSEKIFKKTGIKCRHIVSKNECASDLAVKAGNKLFDSGIISRKDIDFLILATQTPDYILPTTACVIQERLDIPQNSGAFDFNLGCSAYVYGLAMSKSLIYTGLAKNVLLITAETYSKHINPKDKSTRTIFGDAAAVTLVNYNEHNIGDFDLGTDGSGKDELIIPSGGAKLPKSDKTAIEFEENGYIRTLNNIYMNGTEIFNFTLRVVPKSIENIIKKHNLKMDDIDLFVFHQANKFMLDYLRKKIKIKEEKFYVNMSDIGNTVSASIPIALKRAEEEGRLFKGAKVLISGFGVGLSWGSTILTY